MNMFLTISEAMQSSNQMDRMSESIVGFCTESQKIRATRNGEYTAYLRRRNRYRRAA